MKLGFNLMISSGLAQSRKERDDLSRTARSWKIQLDGRMVFGTAGGTYDLDV